MIVLSVLFEVCPFLLDGVEIGRVWRQEEQQTSGGGGEFLGDFGFMEASVIEHDDGLLP